MHAQINHHSDLSDVGHDAAESVELLVELPAAVPLHDHVPRRQPRGGDGTTAAVEQELAPSGKLE
jgi:hypothetical protein